MGDRVIRGSCLCGSVRFEVRSKLGTYRYCYCALCRKNRGTRHTANVLVNPEDYFWTQGKLWLLVMSYRILGLETAFAVAAAHRCHATP